MRTLPSRVAFLAVAYVFVTLALFLAFRQWGGGSMWGSAILHNLNGVSLHHHFVPPWTTTFAATAAIVAVISVGALCLAGRRAANGIMGVWSVAFTVVGALLAAVPHLSVIATEPGTLGIGHTAPRIAAALIFFGFVLTLRVATPDLFRSSK